MSCQAWEANICNTNVGVKIVHLFPLQYLINSWLDLVLNTQRKGPPQVASRPFPLTSNSASHTLQQKPFSTAFIKWFSNQGTAEYQTIKMYFIIHLHFSARLF